MVSPLQWLVHCPEYVSLIVGEQFNTGKGGILGITNAWCTRYSR